MKVYIVWSYLLGEESIIGLYANEEDADAKALELYERRKTALAHLPHHLHSTAPCPAYGVTVHQVR